MFKRTNLPIRCKIDQDSGYDDVIGQLYCLEIHTDFFLHLIENVNDTIFSPSKTLGVQ